jgi:hypothetical protein
MPHGPGADQGDHDHGRLRFPPGAGACGTRSSATGTGSACRARLAVSPLEGLEGRAAGLPGRPLDPGRGRSGCVEPARGHPADWRIASNTDNLRRLLSCTQLQASVLDMPSTPLFGSTLALARRGSPRHREPFPRPRGPSRLTALETP